MDYSTYLDAEILAFIDQTNAWYPPGTHKLSIKEQRDNYDAMCLAFARGHPESVRAKDMNVGLAAVRSYRRIDPVVSAQVMYIHGGGLVLGGLDSHDDVCAEICAASGLNVHAVDYRLAPEHSVAGAVDDCVAAMDWVRNNDTGPIIICGDSGGAYLGAVLADRNRNDAGIVGQVLIYPGLGGDVDTASMRDHAHAPLLSADEVRYYRETGGREVAWPLDAGDFSGLPPTFVAVAECDPLADDGRAYVDALKRAGVTARLSIDHGLVHGHLRARLMSAKSAASFDRITSAISDMAARRF